MGAVVAAGDSQTAQAAFRALEAGGNAADAAVAGCLAAFVAEPLLASAGGAGLMTLALKGQEPVVVDFFSRSPGLGGVGKNLDFFEVVVDFGTVTQSFHVGRASAAVPCALPGLAIAAQRYGNLNLSQLVEPAVELARLGARLSEEGALVFKLLWPIQEISPEAAILAGGKVPVSGQRIPNPDLANLLEEFGKLGSAPKRFDEGLVRHFGPALGGLIGEADLAAAKPIICAPRRVAIGNWEVLTSPKVGGARVAEIAQSLWASDREGSAPAEALRIAQACRRASADCVFEDGRGSTTHLSVIDAEGGAASVTLTNGEGSGHVIPGTGVQVNNFLGEEDLNPSGFHHHAPGTPLPTMIAPTIVLHNGVPALALGSGGSNRIRSVVAQVLYRVAKHDNLSGAVLAPRIHAEVNDVWIEMSGRSEPDKTLALLGEHFERVHPFEEPAFFFGGVHAVRHHGSGMTEAIGDPRRGGASLTIPESV